MILFARGTIRKWYCIHRSKWYQITTNQPTNLNNKNSQSIRFLIKKKQVLAQNKKFPGKKINVNFQAVPTERFLHSRSKRQETSTQGRTERMNPSAQACCMIEGWDLKYLWKRVCMQAARRHIFHGRSCTPLSLYTDLNSNATTCKVCFC